MNTSRDRTPRITTIQHQITKSGKCPTCGRKVSRSRTFKEATDGRLTALEVHAKLTVEAIRWYPNFEHKTCQETR